VKVIVPALPDRLHPRVVPALLEQGHRVEVVPLGPGEEYFELFVELWRAGDDFALVEHDVEVHAGVLAELEACEHSWCGHSYTVFWGDLWDRYGVPGLGCTRFRAELLAELPEVPDLVAVYEEPNHPPRHWMTLDAAVAQVLRGPFRQVPHRHRPNVAHHHVYDYVGAYVPDDVRATLEPDHPLALPPTRS
jgi:hypothetical protein